METILDIYEYQEKSSRTIPSLESIDTHKLLLVNFAMGLSGETGELVDHIKKHVFHGHDLDLDYVTKELGDILWYIAGMGTIAEIGLDQVCYENIEKLKKRYPNGFSEEASKEREEYAENKPD